jgi:hypothetical protein
MSREQESTRRVFLRDLGRIVVAGLLVGGVGAVVRRNGAECDLGGRCDGCPALQGCERPEADAARNRGG